MIDQLLDAQYGSSVTTWADTLATRIKVLAISNWWYHRHA